MDQNKLKKSAYTADLEATVRHLEALRRDPDNPVDVTLAEMVHSRYGVSMSSFYEDMGINPGRDTIENIFNTPTEGNVRWLIPEIIRDALRLGLRKNPIWMDVIASEQTIANPSVVVPWFNISEATAKYTGEAETFAYGSMSYDSKEIKIRKLGRALRLPYEVMQYVSINLTAIWLQDFGVKLNQGIDALMITTLLNGEQDDGSESAAVVGIETANTLDYKDLLRVWVRMGRLGRMPSGMIVGEALAVDLLNLDEFKNRQNSGPLLKTLDLKTPVPQTQDLYIHGNVPNNRSIIIDKSSSIIKYNSQPLLIETEKIIQNQTIDTVASLTTGFGILYRDGRIVMDRSLAFSSNGFPTYMDVDAAENVTFAR